MPSDTYPPIHLDIRGDGEAFVSIEVNGRWVTVIKERHCKGGHTSHIVESLGIQCCIDAAMQAEADDGE